MIKAPLGELPPSHSLVNFTTALHSSPFPTPLATTTQGALAAIADQDTALVSIHVANYPTSSKSAL